MNKDKQPSQLTIRSSTAEFLIFEQQAQDCGGIEVNLMFEINMNVSEHRA